ncbi:MAG: hypothetical protein ACFFC6_11460 [Promethearchaeota archaeon]
MKNMIREDPISEYLEEASKQQQQAKGMRRVGFLCNPCDPLLPLQQPETFFGENPQIKTLIAKIIDFIHESANDLLFLKGPRGSGKTVIAHIFKEYGQKLNILVDYQDAKTFLTEKPIHPDEKIRFKVEDKIDVIFLDRAFSIHKTLSSINTPTKSPKIIAIMDNTEFEIYRRLCIQRGDRSYQHFLSMPHLTSTDIIDLLDRRLKACYGGLNPPITDDEREKISELAFGNPGVALKILLEFLTISRRVEDIRFTFGIIPDALKTFPSSKSPILREILVREVRNDYLPPAKREYLIHKELTELMSKTKSTISHHLGDLLSGNLIYEQSTGRDLREKAYRPNKAIFGILERLAFKLTIPQDTQITFEGMNREK